MTFDPKQLREITEEKVKLRELIEVSDFWDIFKGGMLLAFGVGGIWFGWTLVSIAVSWATYFLGAPL